MTLEVFWKYTHCKKREQLHLQCKKTFCDIVDALVNPAPGHHLFYLTSLFWYVYSLLLPHYSNIHNETVYHLLIVLMVPQCLLSRSFFHAHYTGIFISACSSNGIQRFYKCNCSNLGATYDCETHLLVTWYVQLSK